MTILISKEEENNKWNLGFVFDGKKKKKKKKGILVIMIN